MATEANALIAVIGDFNPKNPTHRFTNAALDHVGLRFRWVPTETVGETPETQLAGYDGLWIAPASPYRSMDGALSAIRYARERGVPLIGTWGGFQHAIVEFARNVLGFRDAEHAETSPDAERLVITPLECSLVGQQHTVSIVSGSRAAQLYGTAETAEDYYCSYGVNPEYHRPLEEGGLQLSGLGGAGEIRIVEIPDHPFFLATLFLPQARSSPAQPHPLIVGYAAAVTARAQKTDRGVE